MGIGTSKANGLFNKELEHAFNFHSPKDPYVPLILIQAHSNVKGTVELPKGIQLFHYCKQGCILRTKKTKMTRSKSRSKSRSKASNASNEERRISMEYACLKKLDIYDTYEKTCPNYEFYIDEVNKEEGGIFLCLDKEIHKLFTFEPGHFYSMGAIVHFIENKLDRQKVNIGILSCRTTNACSNVIVALPTNKRAHSPFRRTVNKKGEENRKGLHPNFALTHKRKRSH
jgi:hypothetical protein